MKITENELNYILTEITKTILYEEEYGTSRQLNKTIINPTYRDLQNDNGDTVSDQSPEITQKTNWNKKKIGRVAKKYGSLALGAAAAATLGAAASLAFNSGFGDFLSGLGFWGGIGSIVAAAGNSWLRYSQLQEMKLPSSDREALTYARYAAAERERLQEQCRIIQRNLHNAFNAYRTVYKNNAVSWEEMINNIPNKGYAILGGDVKNGKVKVNYKTDFEDRYVKESIIKESENSLTNTSTIVPKNTFTEAFTQMNDSKTALGTVLYLAKAYNEMYGLWMHWSRYIGTLIAKFPKTLTWETVIDSNKNYGTGQIITNLAKAILPRAVSQFIPDYQKKDDNNKNEFDDYIVSAFTLTLIDNDYHYQAFDKNNTKHFYLFDCEENTNLYALPWNNKTTNYFRNININTSLEFEFSRSEVISKFKNDENQTIFVLSNTVLDSLPS